MTMVPVWRTGTTANQPRFHVSLDSVTRPEMNGELSSGSTRATVRQPPAAVPSWTQNASCKSPGHAPFFFRFINLTLS